MDNKWDIVKFSCVLSSYRGTVLLSEKVLPTFRPVFWRLLLLLHFLSTDLCVILMGIPPKSKSSFKDFVKNLSSASDSIFFPLRKATNVGGRAFTWVKYLILGWADWSFQECLPITWSPNRHSKGKSVFYNQHHTLTVFRKGKAKSQRHLMLTLRNQRLRRDVGSLKHHFW